MLKYGDSGEEVKLLQRALNELLGREMKADGDFGKLTEEALRLYQKKNRLTIDGAYGPESARGIEPLIEEKYLKTKDIETESRIFGFPTSLIKAIRHIEARGEGFLPDGRVVILFERHKFYLAITKKFGRNKAEAIRSKYPSICSPERGGYLGYAKEYTRLTKAASFDAEAAYLSASFGLFQIMGFNYQTCGYSNVFDFVRDMQASEKNHLTAVLNFIKNNKPLSAAVKRKDFAKVALYYNGAANATNNYIAKLTNADRQFS